MKSRPPSEIVKRVFIEFVALDTKRTAGRVAVSDNDPYVKLVDFIELFQHASDTPQKA